MMIGYTTGMLGTGVASGSYFAYQEYKKCSTKLSNKDIFSNMVLSGFAGYVLGIIGFVSAPVVLPYIGFQKIMQQKKKDE
jgi:hypothetical protein